MIPKIIHYCWFGGAPLPKSAVQCINTWKKYFPEYEIKVWDENNFDYEMLPYTRDAYKAKKYAFVSDVARFWILYNEGGIYFDTDVEVIAKFDDIIADGAFAGAESPSENGSLPAINPGLAIGSEKGNLVMKSILDYYSTLSYSDENGERLPGTVVTHATFVLGRDFALQPSNEIQKLDGITIYPVDYFNPFNDLTGVLVKTNNTRSIHWFAKSWQDAPMLYFRVTRILHRLFGVDAFDFIKKIFSSKK